VGRKEKLMTIILIRTYYKRCKRQLEKHLEEIKGDSQVRLEVSRYCEELQSNVSELTRAIVMELKLQANEQLDPKQELPNEIKRKFEELQAKFTPILVKLNRATSNTTIV